MKKEKSKGKEEKTGKEERKKKGKMRAKKSGRIGKKQTAKKRYYKKAKESQGGGIRGESINRSLKPSALQYALA